MLMFSVENNLLRELCKMQHSRKQSKSQSLSSCSLLNVVREQLSHGPDYRVPYWWSYAKFHTHLFSKRKVDDPLPLVLAVPSVVVNTLALYERWRKRKHNQYYSST